MQQFAINPTKRPTDLEDIPLELRILSPNIPKEEISTYVDMLNRQWGDFFEVTHDVMKNRLNSGAIFLGAYLGNNLVGILETLALEIEEVDSINAHTSKERAREVCARMPDNYNDLTHNGHWRRHPKYANVLTLVDITVDAAYRKYGIASKMIDYGKAMLLELNGVKRPPQIEGVEYVPTFTPEDPVIIRWHERNWAFDTEFKLDSARPGYKVPIVNFMCCLAPGYIPQLGQRELPKTQ